MFPHVRGGIQCCSCRLAPLVISIFTTGTKDLSAGHKELFGEIKPCEICGGTGCVNCLVNSSLTLYTRTEAIEHLKEHIKAGHIVPDYAIKHLEEELKDMGETKGIEIPTIDN
jgi:hypothetical protein